MTSSPIILAREQLEGEHSHTHAQNRFAVIPTDTKLDADKQLTGRGVTIAFIDSGFYPHPDLTEPRNRIVAFEDVTRLGPALEQNARPQGWDWHGTQTSVVACGSGHLSDGLYRGLASDSNVVLVKVSAQGKITEENIARGIRWVVENKQRYAIRVISISLGGDADRPYRENIVDQAAEEAVAAGLVVVVAAGNSGCTDSPHVVPPANSPSVITVGGYNDRNKTGNRDLDLYCSSYGQTVDGIIKPEIVAPAIWVAAPILPRTELFVKAESLSRIAAAPDYLISDLARELWREAEIPKSLHEQNPDAIRLAVEHSLRQFKIVATHYQHVDGTSFAAPIVTSVVAQMIEANPQLTPAVVKDILISTAEKITNAPRLRQGYGRLNARRATERARVETHTLDQSEFGEIEARAEKMVFLYHDDEAESVALAGDFNGWSPASTVFTRGPYGIWRARIDRLEAGRYRYKIVVNGNRWIEDPRNQAKEPDGYDGFNSVLIIN